MKLQEKIIQNIKNKIIFFNYQIFIDRSQIAIVF